LDEISASNVSTPNSIDQANPSNSLRKIENLENNESGKCSSYQINMNFGIHIDKVRRQIGWYTE
jgi:hypothetical protein